MKKPQNIKLIALLFAVLLISTITVVVAQVSQTHVISAGVSSSYDHTVWTNGASDGADTYYCKNAYGALEISSGDASDVFDYVIARGGAVKVLSGNYYCDRQMTITRSITIEGSGVNVSGVTGMPDDLPTNLYGTVFIEKTTDNLFVINTEVNSVTLRAFGCTFLTTGDAMFTIDGASGGALIYGRFEDLMCLGSEASAYSYVFCNIQHLTVSGLRSWNSGFMWIRGFDATPYDYGNSIFSECYSLVKRALTVPAVVFIELEYGNKINLLQFDRLQLNNMGTNVNVAMLRVDDCRYTTFTNLDIETLSDYPIVNNANCRGITYINPYVWVDGNGGILDFLGDYTTVIGGILDGCNGAMTNGTNLACYNTYRYLG